MGWERRNRGKKINWTRAFAKKGSGEPVVVEEGEIGLSRWMNNEACFQHFKGKGEKETVKLRYVLCRLHAKLI